MFSAWLCTSKTTDDTPLPISQTALPFTTIYTYQQQRPCRYCCCWGECDRKASGIPMHECGISNKIKRCSVATSDATEAATLHRNSVRDWSQWSLWTWSIHMVNRPVHIHKKIQNRPALTNSNDNQMQFTVMIVQQQSIKWPFLYSQSFIVPTIGTVSLRFNRGMCLPDCLACGRRGNPFHSDDQTSFSAPWRCQVRYNCSRIVVTDNGLLKSGNHDRRAAASWMDFLWMGNNSTEIQREYRYYQSRTFSSGTMGFYLCTG